MHFSFFHFTKPVISIAQFEILDVFVLIFERFYPFYLFDILQCLLLVFLSLILILLVKDLIFYFVIYNQTMFL